MAKKEKLSIGAVLIILLLLGTFFDLGISKAIYSPGAWFPVFFELLGEAPGLIIGVFCCTLLIVTRDTSNKLGSIVQFVIFGILMLLLSVMSAFQIHHYMDRDMGITVALLAAVYVLGCCFLSTKIDKTSRGEIRRAAVIGLLLIVFAIVSVNVIKIAWGRPRFRSMQEDMSVFTPWYLPQTRAAGEEFKSFPSGHTANAAVIIWITLLPGFVPKLADKKVILNVIAYGWTVCVMLSRIMAGAHFLSDVTIGAACTFIGFLVLCKCIKVKPSGMV